MKPCKKFEERISEMLFGEIPENEEHMLHIHMASCEGCMGFYLSLYETLEADDKEEFFLTEKQKCEIFEVAEKLDRPIKRLSAFWTTGVSIAASLIVSGIIILSKGSRNSFVSYDKASKSEPVESAGEISVSNSQTEYLEIPPPAQESEKKSTNSPRVTTVKIENVDVNDTALADTEDEAPSTDDNMADQAVSDVVVSPSAFATPQVFGGRTQEGRAQKYELKEKNEPLKEALDLVLDEKPAEGLGGLGGYASREGKEDKTLENDRRNADKKPDTKYAIIGDALTNELKPGEQNKKDEFYLGYTNGKDTPAGEKDYKDKGGSGKWISPEDKKNQGWKLSESKNDLEKTLSEDPFNQGAIASLEKVNRQLMETGRGRGSSEDADLASEVEWRWSKAIIAENNKGDKTTGTRLETFESEKEAIEELTKLSEAQKGKKGLDNRRDKLAQMGEKLPKITYANNSEKFDLSNPEEALKQQRELEADNSYLNAIEFQKGGNVEGAKEELEKAIQGLSSLAKEPRVVAKKEKYKELYSSLIEKKTAKRPMLSTQAQPMSTFSIDVDTASYQMAKHMIQNGQRPVPLSIRAEEFINSFNYKYEAPKDKAFSVHTEVVDSAFHRGSKILKIGVQGKRPGGDHRSASHFCFIVDTSGSMADKNRLPMVKRVLPMIIKQMSAGDKVSLVSCGLNSRLELDHIDIQNIDHVMKRIESLNAVGATNLEASLSDGYRQVLKHVKKGTYSRVVLFSDGVANLGEQNADNILKKLSHAKGEGVGITVIGMGEEEYNDNFLETLADKGDGNYVYIGNSKEAQKTFEKNFAATFHTIAYNVKIQVEFDPSQVSNYRLVGYENRRLKNKDFRNDKVDAGEVGSGQSVTAIYEVEMTGKPSSKAMAEVRLRYRDAVDSQMKEFSTPVLQNSYNIPFEKSSEATRLAFISGKFAEVLRDGGNSEGITIDSLLKYMRPLAAESNNQEIEELKNLIEKSR